MATKPKSYKKNGYTYTESSPGSNKYQNFTAAKPTVKAVRDVSRADKANVAATKAFPKGLADRQVIQAKSAQGLADRQPMPKSAAPQASSSKAPFSKGKGSPSVPPRGQEQRFRPAPPKAKLVNRQGGMDTGNVMKSNAILENSKWAKAYEGSGILRGQSREAYRTKRKESFMSRTRRKGIIGALFGD
jgi:hypothetical protein